MNNQELNEFFAEIAQCSNCFDRELMLRAKTKEYKKSDFFKKTWMPIHKAFLIYQANAFNSLSCILNSPAIAALATGDTLVIRTELEKFLVDFDTSSLDDIIDYFVNKLGEAALDTSSLINTFKSAVKDLGLKIK